MINIKDSLFKEYDLRGIVGDEITPDVSYKLGLGFGSFVRLKGYTKVVVGYDNRLSSIYLTDKLINGLVDSGVDVIKLGLVTTPMFYCAKYKLNIDTGIMVTASHNPKEYNGYKVSFDHIGNAYGNKIRELRDYIKEESFLSGKGDIIDYDIRDEYLDLIKSSIDIKKRLKVVVDCGNGTASVIAKDIFNMFDIDCEYIYCESDGNFPNHHPDPSKEENMKDLRKKVVELNYDLGISFDGDADRVGFVDNLGKYYTADYFLALMSTYMKDNLDRLLFDVKCSKMLIDACNSNGIKPCIYKTGASYTNMEMKEKNYLLGGEYSGHIFFRDRWPGFDDGIYAGLRLIEMLSNTDLKLNALLNNFNHYENEYIEYPINIENKEKYINKLKEYALSKDYKFIDIDGIRVEFDDGFALIRASNTQPILTIRFEANTKDRLTSIKNEFITVVDSIKKDSETLIV